MRSTSDAKSLIQSSQSATTGSSAEGSGWSEKYVALHTCARHPATGHFGNFVTHIAHARRRAAVAGSSVVAKVEKGPGVGSGSPSPGLELDRASDERAASPFFVKPSSSSKPSSVARRESKGPYTRSSSSSTQFLCQQRACTTTSTWPFAQDTSKHLPSDRAHRGPARTAPHTSGAASKHRAGVSSFFEMFESFTCRPL